MDRNPFEPPEDQPMFALHLPRKTREDLERASNARREIATRMESHSIAKISAALSDRTNKDW